MLDVAYFIYSCRHICSVPAVHVSSLVRWSPDRLEWTEGQMPQPRLPFCLSTIQESVLKLWS